MVAVAIWSRGPFAFRIISASSARFSLVSAEQPYAGRGVCDHPLSLARYRQRHSTSGAESDAAAAHPLAKIVRCTGPTIAEVIRLAPAPNPDPPTGLWGGSLRVRRVRVGMGRVGLPAGTGPSR